MEGNKKQKFGFKDFGNLFKKKKPENVDEMETPD